MAQRNILTRNDSLAVLRRAAKGTKDEGQKTRIRAIISIKEGMNHREVAERFIVNRHTVGEWVKRYNEGGVDALFFSKGGRPEGNPVWDSTMFDALAQEIDTGGRYWSVPLMQEWIREKYQKDIPENTVWYHMRNLKYSFKSARTHPYQGNTEAQEAFKKGVSVPFSRKSETVKNPT